MNTPVTVNFRDFLNKDCSCQPWFWKLIVTITRTDTTGGLKCVAFFRRHCEPIKIWNTPSSQKNQWLILSSTGSMSSIYCYLTRPAKVFCELSTLCILNLTYIPECFIFTAGKSSGTGEWLEPAQLHLKNVCPKVFNMLNCCSQTWMEVKKGERRIFLLSPDTHSSISFARNECKTDSIKWAHESSSECAPASLVPLVSAGSSCGLEWTETPLSSQQRKSQRYQNANKPMVCVKQ